MKISKRLAALLDRLPPSTHATKAIHGAAYDLRRTYARLLHDAGVPLLDLQQNLVASEAPHGSTCGSEMILSTRIQVWKAEYMPSENQVSATIYP